MTSIKSIYLTFTLGTVEELTDVVIAVINAIDGVTSCTRSVDDPCMACIIIGDGLETTGQRISRAIAKMFPGIPVKWGYQFLNPISQFEKMITLLCNDKGTFHTGSNIWIDIPNTSH